MGLGGTHSEDSEDGHGDGSDDVTGLLAGFDDLLGGFLGFLSEDGFSGDLEGDFSGGLGGFGLLDDSLGGFDQAFFGGD